MSSEATVQTSLSLRIGNLNYTSAPPQFRADVAVAGGPTPGEILATKAGTNANLSALTKPGLCWFQNLGVDSAGNALGTGNYVEWGIWDPTTNQFYCLGEVLSGECYVVRLSRFIGQDIGTGSGTTPSATNKSLRFKAIGTACKVIIQAFEA